MPTKKQLQEADQVLKGFDWSRFDAMSDGEIKKAWAWDKDTRYPADEELAEFDLIIPAKRRKKPRAAE